MPSYENISIAAESEAGRRCVRIGASATISGAPDITFTWVRDEAYRQLPTHLADFAEGIQIGANVYMESCDRLAFHCGRVKLTLVKRNAERAGRLVIGDGVVLQGTAIVAYQQVTIEDHVTFGPNVTLMDSSGHPLIGRGETDEAARIVAAPVRVREHAWIGMNAIILKGVTIGAHAVIGAGSVVSRDVPDYALAVGNPAQVVKWLR